MPAVTQSSPGQEIALADAIETLRRELEIAQLQGAGRPVAFGIEKVELELKVLVSRKAKGDGGIKFWVVNAAAGAESGSEGAQVFKLTLTPLDAGTKKRLEVASKGDVSVSREK